MNEARPSAAPGGGRHGATTVLCVREATAAPGRALHGSIGLEVPGMPRSAPTPCRTPQCPELGCTRGYCQDCWPKVQRKLEEARPSAHRRGYTARHRRVRRAVVLDEKVCRSCGCDCLDGRGEPASHAHCDHIRPKREGGTDRRDNLQCLCRTCHSIKTAREDKRWG